MVFKQIKNSQKLAKITIKREKINKTTTIQRFFKDCYEHPCINKFETHKWIKNSYNLPG